MYINFAKYVEVRRRIIDSRPAPRYIYENVDKNLGYSAVLL
jgi:hypothetical protein